MNVADVYGVGHRAFLHAYCAIAVYLYYLVRSFVGIAPEFRKGVGAVKYLLADAISVRNALRVFFTVVFVYEFLFPFSDKLPVRVVANIKDRIATKH